MRGFQEKQGDKLKKILLILSELHFYKPQLQYAFSVLLCAVVLDVVILLLCLTLVIVVVVEEVSC